MNQTTALQGPDFSLHGKRVLITGSTQGLGLAMAHACAAHGAHVMINGRDGQRAQAAADTITSQGGKSTAWIQDVSDLDTLQFAYKKLCETGSTPDILINNVGIRRRKRLADTSLTEIVELINVNLVAAIELSRLAAQTMQDSKKPGRIITLTSIAGELARYGDAIYPVAKQGLVGLVRSLAVEYGRYGITSNGIAPGTFATETNAALASDPVKGPKVLGRNPLARWARPDEITGAAIFLASPAASYVNGHIIVIDGGFSVTF